MEVISFIEGATRLAFNWDEVRPKEGAPLTSFMHYLQETYSFEEAGYSPTAAQAGIQAPLFRRGVFEHEGIKRGINSVEVVPDGVVVSCTKTEFAESFIRDAMARLEEEFGYRSIKKPKATYQSSIVSDLGFDMASTLGVWNSVVDRLGVYRGEDKAKYEPTSLRFLVPSTADTNADTLMVFERRYQAPIDKYCFYSLAPITSDQHVDLLGFVSRSFGRN